MRNSNSTANTSHRKVIDVTAQADDEVVILSSMMLSDISCDLSGAITVLNDIGALLNLIYAGNITTYQAASMARLSHDAADTWADLLCRQMNDINESLAFTKFGEVKAND